MLMDILNPFVECRFVKTVQVSQVDLEPAQTPLSERLRLSKQEEPTTKVVADMV